MDHARFDAWARKLATPSRRRVLGALGGLMATTLGLVSVSDRVEAEARHVCCSSHSTQDDTVLAGCFKKQEDGCAPIPEGYWLYCKQPVHSCGDCSKTVCPNTKKG
jgi:hypothetical protein